MYKLLILFLFIAMPFYGQQSYDYSTIDSLSYNYFATKNWDKLLEISKVAKENNIDFKHLQQRVGFAYFSKGDYFSAQKHYEKALKFDAYDTITRTYLYSCGLYTGNIANARYHAEKLPQKSKESIDFKPTALLSLLDMEYNYKANTSAIRSNPNYIRGGIGSNLSARLNLYQSISTYSQDIDKYSVKQDEYYAIMGWTATSMLKLIAQLTQTITKEI